MEPRELNITLKSLLLWVFLPVLVITLFGILPTWLVSGWNGIWAELVAVGAVLFVMVGTGIITVRTARRGAGIASTVFLGSSLIRIVLCPGFTTLLWYITKFPAKTMLVWMLLAYITCLGLECVWMVRALRQATSAKENEQKETGSAGFS